jgi:hypothetical protein
MMWEAVCTKRTIDQGRRMSRTYLTFGDIDGKLEMLRIECTRCPRKGSLQRGQFVRSYGLG